MFFVFFGFLCTNRYTCDKTPSITVEAFIDSSCSTSAGAVSYTSCYFLGSTLYDTGSLGIFNVSVYGNATACVATPNTTETTTSTPVTTKKATTTKMATEAATTTKTATEMATTQTLTSTTNSNIMTTASDATTTRMATTKLTTRLATEMTTTEMTTTKMATTQIMTSNSVTTATDYDDDLADGWVNFGGITVPTDECIFDTDGNSYIFMCDSDGNMTSEFYSGVDDCSVTPVTTPVSGLEYDCDPVGYVTTEIVVSNPFGGSSDCAISYASTAIATGVCHYSDFADAYVMYVYFFVFLILFCFLFFFFL